MDEYINNKDTYSAGSFSCLAHLDIWDP